MMFQCRTSFYILLLILLASCRKDWIQPEILVSSVAKGVTLKAVCFLDPVTGFVSGGQFEEQGYIYKTYDGGDTWENVFTADWSVNDVRFLSETEGYACGDSLHILKTTDQGQTWELMPLSWYPYEEYLLPLKHIEFANDTTWYFTGGRYYQYGINVRTQYAGSWWDNEVFQVELNTSYFRDGNHGLLAGYGIIYKTPDANVTFIPEEFEGDNITSLSFPDPDRGMACGFNGGVYSTEDGGETWNTLVKPNGYFGHRIHFNAVRFTGENAMVVGDDGVIYYSSSSGRSWSPVDAGTGNDLNGIDFIGGQYLVVGTDGTFLRIRI